MLLLEEFMLASTNTELAGDHSIIFFLQYHLGFLMGEVWKLKYQLFHSIKVSIPLTNFLIDYDVFQS